MEKNLTKISTLSKQITARNLMLGLIITGIIIWKVTEGIGYLPAFINMYGFYIVIQWFLSQDQNEKYIHIQMLVSNNIAAAIISGFGGMEYGSFNLFIDLLILYFAYQGTAELDKKTTNQSEKVEINKVVLRTIVSWPTLVFIAILLHKYFL